MRTPVKFLLIGLFIISAFYALEAQAQVIGNQGGSVEGLFVDVTLILEAIRKEIPILIRFTVALSYTMGFILFVTAVLKLKAYGNNTVMSSSHANLTVPFVYAIVGTAMIYFPTMIDVGTMTVFSASSDSILAYPGSQGYPIQNLFASVVAIVQLVGYIAFLRGWIILSKLGSNNQQGTMSKGLVHILGGILAVNILATWEVVRQTLGYII